MAGYTVLEARSAGCTIDDIREAGYVEGVRAAGYTIDECFEAIFSCEQVRRAVLAACGVLWTQQLRLAICDCTSAIQRPSSHLPCILQAGPMSRALSGGRRFFFLAFALDLCIRTASLLSQFAARALWAES